MLKQRSLPPLVSVSNAQAAEPSGEKASGKRDVAFSFYKELGGAEESGPDGKPRPAPQRANPQQAVAEAAREVVAEVSGPRVGADSALPARYTLQAGAHSQMERAKVQMDKLESKGLEPHVIAVEGVEGAKVYKVRVGKFHTMDEARNFQGEIQRRGVDTFVTPL
jgi:cell division protein FtsN